MSRWRLLATTLMATAALTAIVGLRLAPERTWAALLLGSLYLLFACLAGTLFISIHYLAGAGWWVVLRRVPEAMMAGLPIAAIALALTLFLGRDLLYPWAGAFMFARMALMLTLWVALADAIRRASLREDHQQLVRYSAIFAVTFAVTFSIASIDWIMSLEPRWASSIFAVYVFAGLLASGIALVTLIVILLRVTGPLRDVVSDSHLHDLGKLLFAFSTFWAYIWVSQYLLIWYGNLPEEIPYYVRRTSHGWLFWFLLNPAINWAIPFLVLLPRAAKRSAHVLGGVCVLMLGGHYLDLYLLLAPDILPAPAIGPLELLVPLGYVSLFAVITQRALSSAPLVPRHDPYLDESLHRETA
jgi:hypothetical protein